MNCDESMGALSRRLLNCRRRNLPFRPNVVPLPIESLRESKGVFFFKDETVWLTQKALAELFGVQVPGINKHIKNIFQSGKLVEASVISILEITADDGKAYQTRFYLSDFDREIKRLEGRKD